jgi:hypothetical protein
MPWGRVDDTYYDHPKLELLVGDGEWPDRLAAAGLNALAWSWCNRFLTDGHIGRGSVARLGGTIELAELLVSVGLWETTSTGYLVHDFLAFNDSREQVLARRQKEAERKAAWRLSHRDTSNSEGGPGGTTSGTASVNDAAVPHHVPPSVPAGQGDVSRRPSQRPSRDSHARTIARIPTRPDPTRPNVEKNESVPLNGVYPAPDAAEPLLDQRQLTAWHPYRRARWSAFKAAWFARGFKLPPQGDPDDPRSQAHVVWEILDNRGSDLERWVAEAPGKTSHQVVAHLIKRWQAIKAEVGVDDEPEGPEWRAPSRPESTAAILERLVPASPVETDDPPWATEPTEPAEATS